MSGEAYPSMDGPYRIIDHFATATGIVGVKWIVSTGSGTVWLHSAWNYGSHESYCIGIYDLLETVEAMAEVDPFTAEVLADRNRDVTKALDLLESVVVAAEAMS